MIIDMRLRLKILPFVFFLLTGCMVGPNYHPPALDIPDSFQYEVAEAQDTLNLDWWKQFDDPVLEELINEALANNNDVKIAAANIENALGILIQVRAPLFPQIGYEGIFSRTRSSETLAGNIPLPAGVTIPNPATLWQAVFTGSWDIDLWGRIRRQVESARANLYSTVEARRGVILSLVAAVANNYIQLRSLDSQLKISVDTKNSYGESVTYFENQFKYGQTSQITVVSAQTQYEIAATKIPQIQLLIVQTENALNILLARNPGPIPRGKTIEELLVPIVPEGLPSELLCQRPDILQAEQQLIAANAQIGAAQALYFPSLSLTGYYGNASAHLHKLFTGPSHIWNFTASVTGPIFTGGAIWGQVIQAKAQEQAAELNYKQTIINAFAEVENALDARTMLIEQLDAQTKLVKASKEYVRLSTLQFKGGYSPYFVVIQAQEQYFPAELSWVQTRSNLLSSLVAIYQSMGGGWVSIAESLTVTEAPRDCD
jgi:multidrug efflux system outer membrane protein